MLPAALDVLGFWVLEDTLSGIFDGGAAGTKFAVTGSGGKTSGLEMTGLRGSRIRVFCAGASLYDSPLTPGRS